MFLFIDTSDKEVIVLQIIKDNKVLFQKRFKARFRQAEKLLDSIDKLFIRSKVKLKDLEKIQVESRGDSFTSLRIGVITANALAFALGIPVVNSEGKSIKKKDFFVVKPEYSQEPNITISKK
jgi:tRNA threonylcarbamoyladenosine biosynthesis protein TsaB